jgi:hypothetical protein
LSVQKLAKSKVLNFLGKSQSRADTASALLQGTHHPGAQEAYSRSHLPGCKVHIALHHAFLSASAVSGAERVHFKGPNHRSSAVPSQIALRRLPHLTAHDVAEIGAEVRQALIEVGDITP